MAHIGIPANPAVAAAQTMQNAASTLQGSIADNNLDLMLDSIEVECVGGTGSKGPAVDDIP